ncbi:hypothetical protein [Streptomyces xanthii]|uniref:Uncharacterized protein n=1 Tax=Streptomyces xanthii TaxID=2768069 RepID=A0A7H1B7Y1_9ACTN|nr:hypothetical protein [Streptomyces xanthii]QNS04836.1 hypothetical protein IAG42_15245 [Streptomyces xanthii]
MGWEKKEPGGTGDVELMAAACTLQLPVAGALAMVAAFDDNDYGQGFNSIGLACVMIFAPIVLPFLGWLQCAVQALPALALGKVLAARVPGAAWRGRALAALLVAAVWAVPPTALGISSYPTNLLVCAAFCAFPGYVATRPWRWVRRRLRMWSAGLFGGGLLALLTLLAGAVAQGVGLLPVYEPPVLTRGELVAEWRDADDGAALRLDADGRARLTRLPAEDLFGSAGPDDPPFSRCTATGTWSRRAGDTSGDAGVEIDVPACTDTTLHWTIGGTREDPELYVLFGDPDAGDLHILTRS